ncbi:MAG TPA: 4Fe-4S binding protein [Synergistaceae bacterium]|nr:4Fe-4S binding protein [Synergistaceae bacterium]HPJ24945.1 4Fe-4S binding protein [Synergistaceae bacterium]HPQ37863.1 4Fe-4S binding protein [Synergistaceae bacterium]
MPWIDEERCIGCGICVENCPAGTIKVEENVAVLDMKNCIRCGICHDICPVKAVEHDSELTGGDVDAQMKETLEHARNCLRIRNHSEDGWASLKRHIKHYRRQKLVAEKILAQLEQILETGDEGWMKELSTGGKWKGSVV